MFFPTEGAVVADRYVLVREIGRGGMGSIWQGYDQQLAAPCALKFILQAFANHPELRARFVREARAVASLQSPHLVAIRSVGEHNDSLYIAMELLEGETLLQRLEREKRLSPELTLTIIDQVASVLTKAHAAGIVHRDLKPDNIWLWEGSGVFIKVLDFGVAKHIQESSDSLKTATGALVGTPHYMSPEQAEGSSAVDFRTDLWALAVIAVESLTGKRPFDGTGIAELLLKVARLPVPSMSEISPEFIRLQAWWARASSRPVEARFQSARELTDQLRSAVTSRVPVVEFARTEPYERPSLPLTASPVTTTPPPVVPGNQALATWAVAAAAGLVTLGVCGAAAFWMWGQAAQTPSAPVPAAPVAAASLVVNQAPPAGVPPVTASNQHPAAELQLPEPEASAKPSAQVVTAATRAPIPVPQPAAQVPARLPNHEPTPRAQPPAPAKDRPVRPKPAVDDRLGF